MRIALISHNFGGGIDHHLNLESSYNFENEYLKFQPSILGVKHSVFDRAENTFRKIQDIDQIFDFATILTTCDRIEIHSILGWPEEYLWLISGNSDHQINFIFHDYSLFAEDSHLLISKDGEWQPFVSRELAEWELQLIKQSVALLAPSIDTANRVSRFLKRKVEKVEFHEDESFKISSLSLERSSSKNKQFNVVIPGHMALQKGALILNRCVELRDMLKLPIDFFVLGKDLEDRFRKSRIEFIGGYSLSALPKLLTELNPSAFWWPTNGAETYSYTLSEFMNSPIPICAPNRGSFPERIIELENAKLVDNPDSAKDHLFTLLEVIEQ